MPRPDEVDFRGWRFETFEERLAFSAEPIADFWIDPAGEPIVEPSSAFVEPLAIAEGHGWNDVAAARQQFGLRGGKQTVAVIDSGIAYDHVALGGGFGRSHRVVGGWDFAERDANPYDDGPAGFHGTHVAGIVGASDRRYSGLAPDVDLVALRVFDDQGGGYFAWVEQALAWVHEHRFAFENPITTVNLSLGTEWNANSLPSWATLEDELKQLASDGIFVAVAAGNSFQTTNAAGLSYPAVSHYVLPVASVDAKGNLSRFSQRDSRVLAAPGEKIRSTLPDAFYGGDGNKNDWGPSSGTSMASPYVAGASVLVREAMTNLGLGQVNQATIADLFRRTADTIYDAITNASYQRINVERALTTLIGSDDYGSTASAATSLGQLSTALRVSGTIASTSDQDFFQFVAARSGQVTLALSGPDHLAAAWQQTAGGRIDGGKLRLDVIAGQTYTVGLAGGGVTIGKYNVNMQLAAAPGAAPQIAATDLGVIEQTRIDGIAVTGNDLWFQVTANRSGRFTTEAIFAHASGNIDIEVYDARQRLIGASRGSSNVERIDVEAAANGRLFVRLRGTNRDVDLRLTNLVAIAGSQVTVSGTAGADTIRWQGGTQQQLLVNGVSYRLAGNSHVSIDGRGGNDSLVLAGSNIADAVSHRPGGAEVTGPNYRVGATGIEHVQMTRSGNNRTSIIPPASTIATVKPPQGVRLMANGFSELAFALFGLEAEADLARARLRQQRQAEAATRDALFCRIGEE
jgi:subtilisin family serine protease